MVPAQLQQQFHTCMPLFIALGDEVRLTIIEVLTEDGLNGNGGMNVKQITEKTSLSRPAISHHLKILKDAGLVGVRRKGTSNCYHLTIQESTRQLMELGNGLCQILEDHPKMDSFP